MSFHSVWLCINENLKTGSSAVMTGTPNLPTVKESPPPSANSAFSATSSQQQQQHQPNQGIATPHPKTTARIQGATPATMMVSPAQLSTTHSVAPVMAPSTSLLGGNGPSTIELLSAFECPVCMEYMLPPYLQCPQGHLVCGNCRPKVNCCPTCRGAAPAIRNLAMEKIANNMYFPCKFATSGCTQQFVHTEKVEHEEICEYRPYSCPCPGASCKWQGNLQDVMAHLMKTHKSITTLQGEDIVFLATDINLPGAVDWVMMQSCFGYYFMLVLEKQDKQDQGGQNYQMFYAVVQLIGAKKEAENFVYRLELSNQRRRLCWEATPRSIHEGVASAIQQSDCLSFDTNHAQLFAENGNLGINVTIQHYPEH
jgi:E3 ubiquitin-protein ligase SIAH1